MTIVSVVGNMEPQRPGRQPPPYLKGKDIKCPFDCLFHYFTRRFEVVAHNINGHNHTVNIKPTEFDTW
jgi:hypothetical protein